MAVVAALLAYEQSLVRADDLSQVKRAFDLNGYVGILYLNAFYAGDGLMVYGEGLPTNLHDRQGRHWNSLTVRSLSGTWPRRQRGSAC